MPRLRAAHVVGGGGDFQRLAPGFLKTVALVKPTSPYGGGPGYEHLTRVLEENVRVQVTELDSGRVPEDADLLLVLAPKELNERQLFAIDQFLMRGGSVVLATSPVPVERYIGGVAVQEIRMLPYPHFPDLRGDSLDPHSPITANLDQLTLNWASPIAVDEAKVGGRTLVRLLQSSPGSWLSA